MRAELGQANLNQIEKAATLWPQVLPIAEIQIRISRSEYKILTAGVSGEESKQCPLQTIYPIMDRIRRELHNLTPDLERRVIEVLDKSCGCRLPFWHDQKTAIVLRELVVNAIEASQKSGGDLVIVELGYRRRSDELVIEVKDLGCGIPPKNLTRIYKEGWSTNKHKYSVRGLGLYYSRRFVREILGGRLKVQNRDDLPAAKSGAKATMIIPLGQQEPLDNSD